MIVTRQSIRIYTRFLPRELERIFLFFLFSRGKSILLRVPDLYMLSHEDYYNMKYILKDKKQLLNIYQVHEFIDSLPSMNIEKRLKKNWRRD